MSFKDRLKAEQLELSGVKRPYESVAFLLLAILVVQQLAYLVYNFVRFVLPNNGITWLSTNLGLNANLQAFFARIINIDNDNWIFIILGLLAFFLYYFLIYLFVWKYCQDRGLAKWTWTLFVTFGPTIFLAPPFVWFAIYVFRPYIARFIKRAVVEFKEFDPNEVFEEEQDWPEQVEAAPAAPEEVVEEEPEYK